MDTLAASWEDVLTRIPSSSWTTWIRVVEKGIPKDTFPPRHDASDPGVSGVQKGHSLKKRKYGRHSDELGLENGGTTDEDEPDD
jgi:hypothetical protein